MVLLELGSGALVGYAAGISLYVRFGPPGL
jgi:hypothetical protein